MIVPLTGELSVLQAIADSKAAQMPANPAAEVPLAGQVRVAQEQGPGVPAGEVEDSVAEVAGSTAAVGVADGTIHPGTGCCF